MDITTKPWICMVFQVPDRLDPLFMYPVPREIHGMPSQRQHKSGRIADLQLLLWLTPHLHPADESPADTGQFSLYMTEMEWCSDRYNGHLKLHFLEENDGTIQIKHPKYNRLLKLPTKVLRRVNTENMKQSHGRLIEQHDMRESQASRRHANLAASSPHSTRNKWLVVRILLMICSSQHQYVVRLWSCGSHRSKLISRTDTIMSRVPSWVA